MSAKQGSLSGCGGWAPASAAPRSEPGPQRTCCCSRVCDSLAWLAVRSFICLCGYVLASLRACLLAGWLAGLLAFLLPFLFVGFFACDDHDSFLDRRQARC